MGTKAGLTVEEYLHTSFPDLDQEYRDGELEERSLPDRLHSETQALIIAFFFALRKSVGTFPLPELGLKLSARRYLIPDVSVFHPVRPALEVPGTPPLGALARASRREGNTQTACESPPSSNCTARSVGGVVKQSGQVMSQG